MSARFSIFATAPSDLERLPDLILRQLQSAAHLSEVLSSPTRCASASVLACASGPCGCEAPQRNGDRRSKGTRKEHRQAGASTTRCNHVVRRFKPEEDQQIVEGAGHTSSILDRLITLAAREEEQGGTG
jgi:hypothetical protein